MVKMIPSDEIHSRWKRYRDLLTQYLPQCEGAFIFSRLNIYYFTGTMASGVFWLPREGEPVLFCRRGEDRAKIETPLKNIVQFNSYKDIRKTFSDDNISMPEKVAAEMNGLPWSLSKSLNKHLSDIEFLSGDKLIAMTRATKSGWELEIIRETGKRHHKCLTELLPPFLHEEMTELQIAHKISEIFYSEGHMGILRMGTFGEEIFQGFVAAGESANYSNAFNGPVGLRGIHPAAPFMGSGEVKWESGTPLIIDNGFMLSGYHTDKTQVYWAGKKSDIPENIQNTHDFCVEIQTMIAKQLKPGAIPSDLWNQSIKLASESPWSEGFMGFDKNKVNFVGHGIGLAVDEYPVLAEGFDLPLEEGMTLAIEPKIGIPGVGMVGTENTFEVTKNGGKPLTGDDYEIITI